jgi:thioredoxin reductase (NADPH)
VGDAGRGVELTLYSRSYCHLCDDMASALERIDVDRDPALEASYGERVPVLAHGDVVLCHYFLDAPGVRAYLTRIG